MRAHTNDRTRPYTLRRMAGMTIVAGALLGGGCAEDLVVPDYNNASLEDLVTRPTVAAIATAATGLLVSGRDEIDDRNGYVSLLGILGRESYNFDAADPRFVTEMLEGQLNPSSPAFGGNLWSERYRNIRTGTTILGAVGKVAALSETQRRAITGFVKTLRAHELLLLTNTRDVNGVVIDVDRDLRAEPAPLVGRAAALDAISALLDEANADLAQGGSSFPFALSSGFTGFDTPATFSRFNRALKARVEVYRGSYATALTALAASFLVRDVNQLNLGVYHVFSTGAGDDQNELHNPGDTPDILAHPSIVTDAERRANGELDLRVQRRIRTLPESRTVRNITTNVAFTHYSSLASPIPIIRNEELILLRAEANLGLNNLVAALDDINFIRVNSGGLLPTAQATLTELLKQKRFSLLFEGGHRWIDLRRYNRLNELPLDRTDHRRNTAFPVPEAECLARGLQTCAAS